MKSYIFCISKEDAKDGNKTGYGYAKSKRSEWIEYDLSDSNINNFYMTDITPGSDFLIYNDKVYSVFKKYLNIDEGYSLIMCQESMMGCESKVF